MILKVQMGLCSIHRSPPMLVYVNITKCSLTITSFPIEQSVSCLCLFYSHKQEADDIVRVAKTANETSAEAYNLLLRTLAGENQTALEIEELNRKWVWLESGSQFCSVKNWVLWIWGSCSCVLSSSRAMDLGLHSCTWGLPCFQSGSVIGGREA